MDYIGQSRKSRKESYMQLRVLCCALSDSDTHIEAFNTQLQLVT